MEPIFWGEQIANGKTKQNLVHDSIFDIVSHTHFLILLEARAVQAKFECRETETGAWT